MFFEKGTSLLFPPADKVIQVYNCPFSYCTGKNKRTQKYIKCSDECEGTVCSKLATVHVDTDSFETPVSSCNDCQSGRTSTKELEKSKMYGTGDMALIRDRTLIKDAQFNDKVKKSIKKIRRRRRTGRVSRSTQSNRKPIHLKSKKEVCPTKPPIIFFKTAHSTFSKKSLISLYRKRRDNFYNRLSVCPCSQTASLGADDVNARLKGLSTEKNNLKLEVEPIADKYNQLNGTDYKNKFALTCYRGICEKSSKKKDKDFVCTCAPKREPAVLCSNNTCSKVNITANKSSFLRLKNKVSNLCFKSIQKLRKSRLQGNEKHCEQGVCQEAFQRQNPNILCTCKEKIKQCSNETCTTAKKKTMFNKSTPSRRLTTLKHKVQKRLRKKSYAKRTIEENVCPNIVVQNESEQTGDPYFEIKVDAIDMCVLNPCEIKDKVMSLGQEKKRSKCVCPSHAVRKQYILKKEACLGGNCQKALKNKTTDFSCKCLKNKIWKCNNSTCNKTVTFKRGKSFDYAAEESSTKCDGNPLFEVRVDNDQMCIINTEEMCDKLDDIHRRGNKLCQSGICREKSHNRNTRIDCKCTKIMTSNECVENTCGDINKCAKRQHKMVRKNFDTASIKNIKSKFSIFCSQMCSKSDNWVNRNKKKKRTRNSKMRNVMTRTQSENVHKRGGLKIKMTRHQNKGLVSDLETKPHFVSKLELKTKVLKFKAKVLPDNKSEPSLKENLKDDLRSYPTPGAKTNKALIIQSKNKSKRKENRQTAGNINSDQINNGHTNSTKIKKGVIGTDNEIPLKQNKQVDSLKRNIHKRKGLILPVPSSKMDTIINKSTKNKPKSLCMCYHECTCHIELEKRRLKQKSMKNVKQRSQRKRKPKKNIKKKEDRKEEKRWAKATNEKKKKYEKEKNKLLKQEEARHRKRKKEEQEVLKLLESKDGARRSNCFVEILTAILSAVGSVVKVVIYALFKILTTPKESLRFVQERSRDPKGTWTMISGSLRDAWRIRKMKICKCFKNSETANILHDTFKEGTLYQTFADKGKTKKEQQIYEIESKARKKRVLKRQRAALYGCRHVLLTTLRKTPCLWVYHVCPECYPQCLSLLGMLKQFWHICLFVAALACWTPCIVACELSRALMCCLLCTG